MRVVLFFSLTLASGLMLNAQIYPQRDGHGGYVGLGPSNGTVRLPEPESFTHTTKLKVDNPSFTVSVGCNSNTVEFDVKPVNPQYFNFGPPALFIDGVLRSTNPEGMPNIVMRYNDPLTGLPFARITFSDKWDIDKDGFDHGSGLQVPQRLLNLSVDYRNAHRLDAYRAKSIKLVIPVSEGVQAVNINARDPTFVKFAYVCGTPVSIKDLSDDYKTTFYLTMPDNLPTVTGYLFGQTTHQRGFATFTIDGVPYHSSGEISVVRLEQHKWKAEVILPDGGRTVRFYDPEDGSYGTMSIANSDRLELKFDPNTDKVTLAKK